MSYVVFCVENAHRLVLMGPPVAGQPTFKSIALSFIEAPMQARRTIQGDFGPEDPCARDATELIRSRFIGKPVKFVEDYYIEPLQRSAGRLTLTTGEDATALLLQAGFATVPEKIPPRMPKPLFDSYNAWMRQAQAGRKGLFAPDAHRRVRRMTTLSPKEELEVVERVKGKETLVLVERVLSPSLLVVSSTEFGDTHLTVSLSGVTSKDAACEAVATPAKFHVERLLLCRNARLVVEGVDPSGYLVGSIVSPKGSFQEELLSKGLVKLHPGTLHFSARAAELRAAEEEGQRSRQGMWKNHVAHADPLAAPSAPGAPAIQVTDRGAQSAAQDAPADFQGVLSQVVSGDTVIVRSDHDDAYVRVSLAGVRCSKNILRDHDGHAPETRVTYQGYAWEAKEFLRVRFLGARVGVHVEYTRTMPETTEVRVMVTLTEESTGANVGATLVEAGYATFFVGKNDVCSAAVVLQEAQTAAQDARRGLHAAEAPRPVKVVELYRIGDARARYYLSFLQRSMQGNRPPVHSAVVDAVLGPSALRVFIRRESFQIAVKVAGVVTPQGALVPGAPAEAWAEEAKDFVRRRVLQREVDVQVYASDRAGNFIAAVLLPDGTQLSIALVEAGLAAVGNAERLPFQAALLAAETTARGAGRGLWSGGEAAHQLPARVAQAVAQRGGAAPAGYTRVTDAPRLPPHGAVVLTEVGESAYTVYLQAYGAALDETKAEVQRLLHGLVEGPAGRPRTGELVAALYRSDKTWCRARVLHAGTDGDTVEVRFIDFGNRGPVRVRDVRAIPADPAYALLRDQPPFAALVSLAFLRPRPPGDLAPREVWDTVYELAEEEMEAEAVYKDAQGTVFYDVRLVHGTQTLSQILLERGLAVLDRLAASVDASGYKQHAVEQEAARKAHRGVWQYGDIDDDDEDDA